MLYIKRNNNGEIIAISKESIPGVEEQLDENDPQLENFLSRPETQELKKLQQTDAQMIRTIEDLIWTLIERNIIAFTDLPEATQQKILSRKRIRDKLGEILS